MVKAEFYHNERQRQQQQHPRHKTQSHPSKHTHTHHKTHSAFVNVTGFFCVKTKRIKRVLLVFVLRYKRKRDSKCLHLVATTTNFRGVLDAVHVCTYISLSLSVCVLREYRFACVRVQVHTLVCVFMSTLRRREST